MYLLYSLLSAAAMAALAPYFLFRGFRQGKYLRSLRQRFGYVPESVRCESAGAPAIWIHAVSVGETLAALPLARELKLRFPSHRLVFSTTTATGQHVARERADFADGVFYFPLDWAGPVRRVLRAVRPAMVVILETEVWPHLLRECRRAGVPVVFVNARVSAKSFRRYQRLNSATGGFLARVLADATLFLTQSEEDSRRLAALGAPEQRVLFGGNLKYDQAPPDAGPVVTWLAEQIERQERWPVVVAGSVVAGEEEAVLAAFDVVQRKWRHALLALAPRKPERFDAAARIAQEGGWNVVRRTVCAPGSTLDEAADIFLLDSVGELGGFYRLADAVFVGGSLVRAGGHNILEPAWFAKPPIFGPSMDNFSDMAAQFLAAGAGAQVPDARELGSLWVDLIENTTRSAQMGRAARELVKKNQGATARAADHIAALLNRRGAQR